MMMIIRMIVAIYSILTTIAVGQEIYQNGFHWVYLLYFISSLLILWAVKSTTVNLNLLAMGLVLLIGTAILTGILFNILDLTHIIIRCVFSLVIWLVLFWIQK